MPRINESHAVIAVAAGATAFAGTKFGLIGLVPSLGPVSEPLVLIALGAVLSTVIGGEGTTGDIIEGVGYGLITVGALALAG